MCKHVVGGLSRTGLSVCEVNTAGLPCLSMSGLPVFLLCWYISSALPWSAVSKKRPPTSSTASSSVCARPAAQLGNLNSVEVGHTGKVHDYGKLPSSLPLSLPRADVSNVPTGYGARVRECL